MNASNSAILILKYNKFFFLCVVLKFESPSSLIHEFQFTPISQCSIKVFQLSIKTRREDEEEGAPHSLIIVQVIQISLAFYHQICTDLFQSFGTYIDHALFVS